MSSPVSFWRICADKTDCAATDLSGRDAAEESGRWNTPGVPMVYAASSRSLACLESLAHLDLSQGLPDDRWLIEIIVPREVWETREDFNPDDPAVRGWDARPEGPPSKNWGTRWASEKRSLILAVPSVIVTEEQNALINPAHPSASELRARRIRRWIYDLRLT
jgi:RES domain-containing protein